MGRNIITLGQQHAGQVKEQAQVNMKMELEMSDLRSSMGRCVRRQSQLQRKVEMHQELLETLRRLDKIHQPDDLSIQHSPATQTSNQESSTVAASLDEEKPLSPPTSDVFYDADTEGASEEAIDCDTETTSLLGDIETAAPPRSVSSRSDGYQEEQILNAAVNQDVGIEERSRRNFRKRHRRDSHSNVAENSIGYGKENMGRPSSGVSRLPQSGISGPHRRSTHTRHIGRRKGRGQNISHLSVEN